MPTNLLEEVFLKGAISTEETLIRCSLLMKLILSRRQLNCAEEISRLRQPIFQGRALAIDDSLF